MRGARPGAVVVALLLGGCALVRDPAPAAAAPSDWRAVATPAARTAVRSWYDNWREALERTRRSAEGRAALGADPVLYDPAAGEVGPLPPKGDYRCRTIKLGAAGLGAGQGGLDYIAYGWFRCRVSGDAATGWRFDKLTGSQRQSGWLFADEPRRAVLLGGLALGDEAAAPAHGRDASRDVVGVVQRLATDRYRIAILRPPFESTLDILELRPEGRPPP